MRQLQWKEIQAYSDCLKTVRFIPWQIMGKELPIRATFFLRQQGRGGQWVEPIRVFTGQEKYRKEEKSPFSSYASGECRSPFFPFLLLISLSAPSFLQPYIAVHLGVRKSRFSSKESDPTEGVGSGQKALAKEEENPWLPLLKCILSPLDIMEKVCCWRQVSACFRKINPQSLE